MKMPIFLTIVLLAFGYCCLGFPEILSPFLAFILIYFVWKAYRFQDDNEAMKRQLQKILEILEKQEAKTANGEVTEEKADAFSADEAGKAE
jgi:type III secretory pathway component EscV